MDRQSKHDDTSALPQRAEILQSTLKNISPSEFEELTQAVSESSGGRQVNRWVRGKLLGKGPYGETYLAFNATTTEVFAVKTVEMPESGSDHQNQRQKMVLDAIKAESNLLRDLNHPNVISYLGFEQTNQYFNLFLEYVPGGSLGETYRKLGRGFDESLTRNCTKQIVEGLAYLHSKGILHRDLRADHILVDLDGVCRISDLRSSILTQHTVSGADEGAATIQGAIFWMAPEILINSEFHGAKSDIWSLGCTVLEMCTGDRPWAPKPQLAVLLLLGNTATRQAPPFPDHISISQEGRDFLDACFQIDLGGRPTAEELKSHPYLKTNTDWRFQKSTTRIE